MFAHAPQSFDVKVVKEMFTDAPGRKQRHDHICPPLRMALGMSAMLLLLLAAGPQWRLGISAAQTYISVDQLFELWVASPSASASEPKVPLEHQCFIW
jgi:hypothetical protein